MSSRACINQAQLYLAGISMGGMLSGWLATRTADVFAGYTVVAGTNPRGFREPHRTGQAP